MRWFSQAISHVLRLREPEERFALLNVTVATLPSTYVRGFQRTAENIVAFFRAKDAADVDEELRSMVRMHFPFPSVCSTSVPILDGPFFLSSF